MVAFSFFVFGSLSFIALLVVLFLPAGKGPAKFVYAGTVPSVSSPKFIHMLSDSLNLPLKQGGSIELINNGDAFLKFLADIDAARSSIDIMVYIWTDGKMSDQVLDHRGESG